VKYDGKDASKCAMRGLRGNALNITIDFSVFVCYNAFCMQSDRRSPSWKCGGLSNLWKGRGQPASLRAVSAKGRGVA